MPNFCHPFTLVIDTSAPGVGWLWHWSCGQILLQKAFFKNPSCTIELLKKRPCLLLAWQHFAVYLRSISCLSFLTTTHSCFWLHRSLFLISVFITRRIWRTWWAMLYWRSVKSNIFFWWGGHLFVSGFVLTALTPLLCTVCVDELQVVFPDWLRWWVSCWLVG